MSTLLRNYGNIKGGFEVVSELPSIDLWEGRCVVYQNCLYTYIGGSWKSGLTLGDPYLYSAVSHSSGSIGTNLCLAYYTATVSGNQSVNLDFEVYGMGNGLSCNYVGTINLSVTGNSIYVTPTPSFIIGTLHPHKLGNQRFYIAYRFTRIGTTLPAKVTTEFYIYVTNNLGSDGYATFQFKVKNLRKGDFATVEALATSDCPITWYRGTQNTSFTAPTGFTVLEATYKGFANITAGTAGTSSATSGSSLAVPYVNINELGIVTDYGTHTHTIDIPTVGNGTLTIQKNGTNVQTFTANQSGNATANITVPTKVSELTNDSGFTTNTGTVTGIKMNGASKGTSGVVDLGTVLTAHQDISGKADKSATVSNVAYDITNKKITKTINGTTTDVVTAAQLVSDGGGKGITEVITLSAKEGENGLSPYLIGATVEGSKLILQTGRKVCLGQLFTSTTSNNALYTVRTDSNQSGWNEKQEQKDYVANSSGSALGNLIIDLPNKNCFNLRLSKTASNTTVDIDFHTTATNLSLRNRMQLNVPYEFIFHALSNDFTLNIKAYWRTNTLETKAISLKRGRSLYIKVIRTNAINSPADVCRFLECVVSGGVCDTNNQGGNVTVVNKNAFLTHDLKSVGTINGTDLMVRLPNYSHWYETPLTVDASSSQVDIRWNTGATGYECNATWNDYLIVQVPEAITIANSTARIVTGRQDILPNGARLEGLPILSQGTTIVLQCASANGSRWTFRGVFPKEEQIIDQIKLHTSLNFWTPYYTTITLPGDTETANTMAFLDLLNNISSNTNVFPISWSSTSSNVLDFTIEELTSKLATHRPYQEIKLVCAHPFGLQVRVFKNDASPGTTTLVGGIGHTPVTIKLHFDEALRRVLIDSIFYA